MVGSRTAAWIPKMQRGFSGLSPKTLAIMRSTGAGPRFVKRGRVFYFLEDSRRGSPNSPGA